jgi:DNA-binding LacI/PurR family transcriptional regulator
VGGRPDAATTRDRLTGFRKALREARLDHDAALERTGSYTSAFGYETATTLLGGERPPDAIVAADDTVAIGCLDALTDRGLRPGIDVAVIGFGDQPIASIRSVALTTIEASAARTGEAAATALIDRAEGRVEGQTVRTVLPHALIVRSSCGSHED